MNISQMIQQSLNHVKAIGKTEMCVLDAEGNIVASTFKPERLLEDVIQLFIKSPVESQVFREYYFFKMFDDRSLKYVLIAKGGTSESYTLGKLEAAQLQTLISNNRNKPDKRKFIKELLLGRIPQEELAMQAKKMHIGIETYRIVYLIEIQNQNELGVKRILKELVCDSGEDIIVELDEKILILIKAVGEREGAKEYEKKAWVLLEMLNSEAMVKAHVSYGNVARHLRDLPKAYQEAQQANDVGKIFYPDRLVCAYGHLGLGRLIYQIPRSMCEMYLYEVFEKNVPSTLDEETLMIVKAFFENNLSIAETARKLYTHRNTLVYRLERIQKKTGLDIRRFEDAMIFYIGMMVDSYLKYVRS